MSQQIGALPSSILINYVNEQCHKQGQKRQFEPRQRAIPGASDMVCCPSATTTTTTKRTATSIKNNCKKLKGEVYRDGTG